MVAVGNATYYEAAGFVHRGDVPVNGPPEHRAGADPPVFLSRYERTLRARLVR